MKTHKSYTCWLFTLNRMCFALCTLLCTSWAVGAKHQVEYISVPSTVYATRNAAVQNDLTVQAVRSLHSGYEIQDFFSPNYYVPMIYKVQETRPSHNMRWLNVSTDDVAKAFSRALKHEQGNVKKPAAQAEQKVAYVKTNHTTSAPSNAWAIAEKQIDISVKEVRKKPEQVTNSQKQQQQLYLGTILPICSLAILWLFKK